MMTALQRAARSRLSTARRLVRLGTWLLLHGGLGVGGLVMVLPLIWMVTTSFKEERAVFTVPIQWLPLPFHPENYRRAYEFAPWGLYLFNSLFVGLSVTLITVSFCTLAGYGFAKYRFWGQGPLFLLVLSTLMIPFHVIMVPLFILTRNLGWLNTYQGLILPVSVSAFGIFMMRQFMLSLPDELLDAARIDGASELGIFWRVVLPLSRPGVTALAIFTFTGNWDSLLWPLVVTTKVSLRTLPLGLALFSSEYRTDYTALMAASTAATVPILVLFLVLQRQFVRGVVMSGLKF